MPELILVQKVEHTVAACKFEKPGDYPEDGVVVDARYMVSGERICGKCNKPFFTHGYIHWSRLQDNERRCDLYGNIVCPGSWVMNYGNGEYGILSEEQFRSQYTEINFKEEYRKISKFEGESFPDWLTVFGRMLTSVLNWGSGFAIRECIIHNDKLKELYEDGYTPHKAYEEGWLKKNKWSSALGILAEGSGQK